MLPVQLGVGGSAEGGNKRSSPDRIADERIKERFLSYHDRGLRDFLPYAVTPHNSASNIGSANMFADVLRGASYALKRREYPFIRVDVAIYMKWLMVIPV